MAILMKQTPIGRRAYHISMDEALEMAAEGKAKQCGAYEIFDEVTDEEVSQGYMTRNMEALPVATKRRGRKPKVEEVVEVAQEEVKPESTGE